MTHKVQITKRAERDRNEAYQWYRTHYSESFANEWYLSVADSIRTLATAPERCGLARENCRFSFELRELLFGRSRRNRHRILFTVKGDVVFVLHIRHSAQDAIPEGELEQL